MNCVLDGEAYDPVTTTVTGTAPVTALRAMPGAPKKGRHYDGPEL